MSLDGIDVSKWQGVVDWYSVAATNKFGVARSSLGMRTVDDMFQMNYRNMIAAGLVPGAYHVVAGDSSGADQAANWKAQLDAAGFDKGLLVLDVEAWSGTSSSPKADVIAAVKYLCNWVRDTYNRTPIIYTGVYWREDLQQHANNFGAELWLAAYVSDPSKYVPTAWSKWTIWQYTSSGSVAGVNGNVDRNYFDGTLRQLKTLAGWEWDELATKDEIRAVVREEVAAAVTASNTNTDKIVNSVADATATITTRIDNSQETVLSTEAASHAKVIARVDTALSTLTSYAVEDSATDASIQQKLQDLADAISAIADSDSVDRIEDLKLLVSQLHRHLCHVCVANDTFSQ